MRKILSLILGLLWALPVWGANCNLYPHSDTSITAGWATSSSDLKTFLNTLDVGTYSISFDIELLTRNDVNDGSMYGIFFQPNNTLVNSSKVSWGTSPVGTTRYVSRTFNITNENKGNITNVFLYGCGLDTSGGTGSAKFTNIKIERGDTATAYTPYNPLCATCDGTIVNYVSATGTVSQSGTPTPDNPIEPVFYQQGNMVLRKVGDYADSYDATTGKITRRVGVKVLDGTENWVVSSSYLSGMYNLVIDGLYAVGQNDNVSSPYSSHFGHTTSWISAGARTKKVMSYKAGNTSVIGLGYDAASADNLEGFKSWLAAQKAAGTPVTVYYPLTTETTENWTESQYCNANEPIKIATTKYNESAFSPLNTALQNAISVVDSVVSNTITQAGRIATLQAQKQTRPNDIADDNEKCPAGKKCLLVEDASGVPHWYEIVESVLQSDYTELEYLRSDGRAYINTNYSPTSKTRIEVVAKVDSGAGNINIVGSGRGTTGDAGTALLVINSLDDNTAEIKFAPTGTWIRSENVNMLEKNRLSLSATKFSVNGDVKETNNKTIPDTDNQPFYIFQRWRPSIASTNSKTQVYEFSIYENDILVRNMIPVKRNSDGAIGMFDTVNDVFYTNAGTGEFIAGDPVAE